MTDFEDEKPGLSGFSKALIVLFTVVAALGVFYFFSSQNAARYRLVLDGEELTVEKGWFFPFGWGRYLPEDRRFLPSYETIIVPEESPQPANKEFKEVAEIDAALLAYLLDIMRGQISRGQPEDFTAAETLLGRAELLTALSDEQKRGLKTMRADVYYAQGKIILQKVADELRKVLEHFREAKISAGDSGKYRDVDHWIVLLESKIRFLESGEAGQGQQGYGATPAPTGVEAIPTWPYAQPPAAPAPAPMAPVAPAPVPMYQLAPAPSPTIAPAPAPAPTVNPAPAPRPAPAPAPLKAEGASTL